MQPCLCWQMFRVRGQNFCKVSICLLVLELVPVSNAKAAGLVGQKPGRSLSFTPVAECPVLVLPSENVQKCTLSLTTHCGFFWQNYGRRVLYGVNREKLNNGNKSKANHNRSRPIFLKQSVPTFFHSCVCLHFAYFMAWWMCLYL